MEVQVQAWFSLFSGQSFCHRLMLGLWLLQTMAAQLARSTSIPAVSTLQRTVSGKKPGSGSPSSIRTLGKTLVPPPPQMSSAAANSSSKVIVEHLVLIASRAELALASTLHLFVTARNQSAFWYQPWT